MNDHSVAMRAVAGLLIGSGLHRIEAAAVRSTRADVLRHVDIVRSTWRRRATNVAGVATLGLAVLLMIYEYKSRPEPPGDALEGQRAVSGPTDGMARPRVAARFHVNAHPSSTSAGLDTEVQPQ